MSRKMNYFSFGLVLCAVTAVACSDDDSDADRGGTSGASQQAGQASGGSNPSAGASTGGASAQGGSAGQGGTTLDGGTGGVGEAGQGADAGAGGESSMAQNVIIDAEGRMSGDTSEGRRHLYFFGRDTPGATGFSAVSRCADACKVTWPPFHAASVVAGDGLSKSDFGQITRADGEAQTTYKGWPLYTFATDDTPEQVDGDGTLDLWHVVKAPFYSVVLMRQATQNGDTGLYLADASGRTIYGFRGDEAGTAGSDPVSTCTTPGCRKAWPVFALSPVRPVSSISKSFRSFIRQDTGEVQLAYGGAPLYYYGSDAAPGELAGLEKVDWILVAP